MQSILAISSGNDQTVLNMQSVGTRATAPVFLLPPLLRLIVAEGICVESLADQIGLNSDELDYEDPHIDLGTIYKCIEQLVVLTENKALGLKMAEHFNFDYLPDIITYINTCSTVTQASVVLDWVGSYFNSLVDINVQINDADIELLLDIPAWLPETVQRFFCDAFFSCVQQFVKQVVGNDFKYKKVVYKHCIVAPIRTYHDRFGCTIEAGSICNKVVADASILEVQLPGAIPAINKFVERRIARSLSKSKQKETFSQNVLKRMLAVDELRDLSIDSLADSFGLNTRTFQRWLSKETVSYQQLLDKARYIKARKLLEKNNTDISDISVSLGFKDRRSFTRAFQKWSGTNPSEYRRKNLCSSKVIS